MPHPHAPRSARQRPTGAGRPRPPHLDVVAFLERSVVEPEDRVDLSAVTRDLGQRLFDVQEALLDVLFAGARLSWQDVTVTPRDTSLTFDLVFVHLKAVGADPLHVRVDTYAYRAGRSIARAERLGVVRYPSHHEEARS